MKLTKKIDQYLIHKLRGGEVNERGNKYENYFAAFRIIKLINNFPAQTDSIFISSQESAFVDDLLIKVKKQRQLYQLKSSQRLKWGFGRKLKTLNFDFSIQRRIEIFFNREFQLFLTVANVPLKNSLNNSLPKHLKKCTEVLLFPYNDSIQNQIINDRNFKTELTKLSALPAPTTDKLESLAAAILGFWVASNKKMVCLEDLYSKLENMGYPFIKSRSTHNLQQHTIDILDAVPDFSYTVSGNYLEWTFSDKERGVIPYQIGSEEFNNIEEKIRINNPENFITLEKFFY